MDLKLRVAAAMGIQEQQRTSGPKPGTVYDWALTYRRPNGRDFSLDRYPPLKALYDDDHPNIVVMKPAQRGISEWAVNYSLFALDRGAEIWAPGLFGLNVLYLFPTEPAVLDFSKERVTLLSEETDLLARLFDDPGNDKNSYDALRFKSIRKWNHLYLRGPSPKMLRGFRVDLLVLDEFDEIEESNKKSIALAEARQLGSEVRRRIYLSTPTLPGHGIHRRYLDSDRQVFEQQCPFCEEWVGFDFFNDVFVDGEDRETWKNRTQDELRRAKVCLRCPNCKSDWPERARLADGRWRAEQPEYTSVRGYKIPWWPFPMVNLAEMAATSVTQDWSEQEEFFRQGLGYPKQAEGGGITVEMLHRLYAELPGGRLPQGRPQNVTMGVDVGARLHFRISATFAGYIKPIVISMGSVSRWEDLDNLMARFGVRLCVVDRLPELRDATAFSARHPGRVRRATYVKDATPKKNVIDPKKGTDIVQIARTQMMQNLQAIIDGGLELWPEAIVRGRDVIAHLTSPALVKVTDAKTGQEKPEWVYTGPDHLFHASLYDVVARRMLRPSRPQFRSSVGPTRTLMASRPGLLRLPVGGRAGK